MGELVLLKLILAHVVGDFILQPKKWVEDKRERKFKSSFLYLHTLVHAILAYLFIGEWTNWQLPVLIFGLHTAIDIWKSLQAKTLRFFVLDQALHLLSILGISIFITNTSLQAYLEVLNTPKFLLIALAYLLVLRPFAFIIDMFTAKWRKQIRAIEIEDKIESLEDAGKNIGMLERFLVLTFILSGNPGAIGMLIAAKSILRFNDLKGASSRKMSEYVLIGTLLSFSLCIVTGLIINYLIKIV